MSANMLSCSCCSAILFYCSVRDWTRFCYVIGFVEDLLFSTLDFNISGLFAVKFAGCVWTEAVSGKKKFGLKNIRMREDGALVRLIVIISNYVNLLEQSGHGSCRGDGYEGEL